MSASSLLLLLLLLLLPCLQHAFASSEVPQSCPAGDSSCATIAENATVASVDTAATLPDASTRVFAGRSSPSPDAIEALLVEKQRISAMLEKSISRMRELEALLASPACPCSAGAASSFAHPLPGAATAAAADHGITGAYAGVDQHTLAKEAAAAAAAAEALRIATLAKERMEAESKRIQAAKLLARATCSCLPPQPSRS
jgi:hypothetical protein